MPIKKRAAASAGAKAKNKRKPLAKKSVARAPTDPGATFSALRDLLLAVSTGLVRQKETGKELMLTIRAKRDQEAAFFAGVTWRKSYVSFFLFPVDDRPGLLEGMSKPLRAKMQGKSCFNFLRVEPELFAELEQLTRRCKDSLDL